MIRGVEKLGARKCARSRAARVLLALVIGCLTCSASRADILEKGGFKLFADFRLRIEADWDSERADDTERVDRNRARVRFRVGFEYEANDHLVVGMRLRSGSELSQQSPHITIVSDIDDAGTNPTQVDFNFDQWYAAAKAGNLHGWAGRKNLPWWRQNELFWDDDVTVTGLAAIYRPKIGENGELAVNLGYFFLPAGMRAYSGKLGLAQLVYGTEIGESGFSATAGVLAVDANPDDIDGAALLLRGNGARDYTSWVASLQGRLKARGYPIVLGADFAHNSESYSQNDPDPNTADNWDQVDAYVLSIKVANRKGNFLGAYYYARVEALAVSSSYAEDDWVRWGTIDQTRATDMKGHEFDFVWTFAKKMSLVTRFYLVDAITTTEDGKRFRVDYNVSF